MATNFYIDNRPERVTKKGEAGIRISVSVQGVRFVTSTGYKINPAKWDAGKQQVKKGATNGDGVSWSTINSALSKMADHFARYEGEIVLKGAFPSKEEIKLEYLTTFAPDSVKLETARRTNGSADASTPLSFWEVYNLFVRENSTKNQWTEATYEKFAALRQHLLKFRKNITFETFNEAGLMAYINFLKDKEEMKNTSILKQVDFVKWFLRWATAKGYNHELSYQTFSPKLKTAAKRVVYLEWEELMKVYNYEIPQDGEVVTLTTPDGKRYEKTVRCAKSMALSRDIFCFSCFTSLRFSDDMNLKRADLSPNHTAPERLTITTIKTADTITIELNKYAQSILAKYSGRKDLRGYVFPRIANQRINEYLKDLCELCEINQPITKTYYSGSQRFDEVQPKYEYIGTHTGRRTFICNALMLGIPAEIVMKWTGHADYKSMKPYIDVTNGAKAKAMDLFNQL